MKLKISISKNQCTELWDSKPNLVLSVKNLMAKSIPAPSCPMEQAEDSFLEKNMQTLICEGSQEKRQFKSEHTIDNSTRQLP